MLPSGALLLFVCGLALGFLIGVPAGVWLSAQ